MSVLLIAGSPTTPSRSTALLDAAADRLRRCGLAVRRLAVCELPADVFDRLAEAVDALAAEAFVRPADSGFEPVHFSRVRCSV